MFENFQAFVNNPMEYLMRARFNVPSNVTDPSQIIQHLLLTGQISQDQYNKAYQKYKQLEASGQLPQRPQGGNNGY